MKYTDSRSFAGQDFNFIVYDEESVKLIPGFEDTCVDVSLQNHAFGTHWSFDDEKVVRNRFWHFSAGEVVLDVGAAFGSYTLTAAIQGAKVYAFEPSKFAWSILEQNVLANPKVPEPIVMVPLGIHEKSGWFDPDRNLFSATKDVPGSLQVVSLNEITRLIKKIDMIKLDVEGAELGIIAGGIQTIKQHMPRILIEEHVFKDPQIGENCEALLRSIGYGSPVRLPHGQVNHSFYASPY